jgi:hypothetical protein
MIYDLLFGRVKRICVAKNGGCGFPCENKVFTASCKFTFNSIKRTLLSVTKILYQTYNS